jgi:hypothetical protein
MFLDLPFRNILLTAPETRHWKCYRCNIIFETMDLAMLHEEIHTTHRVRETNSLKSRKFIDPQKNNYYYY